jgi:hypothetical protein
MGLLLYEARNPAWKCAECFTQIVSEGACTELQL